MVMLSADSGRRTRKVSSPRASHAPMRDGRDDLRICRARDRRIGECTDDGGRFVVAPGGRTERRGCPAGPTRTARLPESKPGSGWPSRRIQEHRPAQRGLPKGSRGSSRRPTPSVGRHWLERAPEGACGVGGVGAAVCMAVREKGRGPVPSGSLQVSTAAKFRRNHQGVFVVAGELQCEDQIRRDVGTAFRIGRSACGPTRRTGRDQPSSRTPA